MARQRKPDKPVAIDPIDRPKLILAKVEAKRALGRARLSGANVFGLIGPLFGYLMAWLNATKPMRAFTVYNMRHGPLMAAGCAYNMFFSIAALLVAGFSILGLVVSGNTDLQNAVVNAVASTTPGLIDTGNGGLATPDQLFSQQRGFSLALIISLATLLFTSLGWIAGLREGIRGIFALPPVFMNFVLLKLRDLGILLVLGVALVVTTVIAGVATAGLDWIRSTFNLSGPVATLLAAGVTPLVLLALDMIVAVVLFKGASMVSMPAKAMWHTALIAGAGSTILRMLSGVLLANVGKNNPVLASYAVVIALFVWFFFLSQVYLIAAGWGTITTADVKARDHKDVQRRRGSLRQRARRPRAARQGAG
ncbi:YihY/virulence factor BrkB family protein [Haematomicrobium sanguinis]|uniref:YihY/virulence factor BrkB family protein n=1 Tax=Haematomicrobium sanguinis TaxID=479106 RepID=UPI00068E14A1|nr:YihY/virulence factor BrkB family protein [Haematomicrobium sanguinis]